MLWSNGGEEYRLEPDREILFDSPKGLEVLNFYSSLVNVTYDPAHLPNYWWDAWKYPEQVVMMILPTWFNYIREVMGYVNATHPGNFTEAVLGIAPIPTGPHGKRSFSHINTWLNVVTKKAEERRDYPGGPIHAEVAWDFLRWLNKPQPDAAPYGVQPEVHNVSRMGDFLVYEGVYPSRISDIENSQAYISQDFWLKSFGEIATTYGRADKLFFGYEEYSREISVDLLEPILAGADVITTVNNVVPVVLKKLPIQGDINHDDIVDIFDLVIIGAAFGSRPGDPNWDPRADTCGDGVIDIFDLVVIGPCFGERDT